MDQKILHATSDESEVCGDAEPPGSVGVQIVDEHLRRPADRERLEQAVLAALADAAVDRAAVSVAIVDDPAIQALNREFLDHDYPTDVLSFSLGDAPGTVEGEVVVSIDTAERTAAEIGWSADDELLLYVVHGVLHLLGYDDHEPGDVRAMRTAEASVLDRLGVERTPRDDRWAMLVGPSRRQGAIVGKEPSTP